MRIRLHNWWFIYWCKAMQNIFKVSSHVQVHHAFYFTGFFFFLLFFGHCFRLRWIKLHKINGRNLNDNNHDMEMVRWYWFSFLYNIERCIYRKIVKLAFTKQWKRWKHSMKFNLRKYILYACIVKAVLTCSCGISNFFNKI